MDEKPYDPKDQQDPALPVPPPLPPEPTPPSLTPPVATGASGQVPEPTVASDADPEEAPGYDRSHLPAPPPIYPDGPIEPSPQISEPVPVGAGKNDSVATASLVMGIVSVPAALCGPIFGVVIGLVAIVLSVVGKNRIAESGAPGAGAVKAGRYLGLAAIVISIVTFVIWITVILPNAETG